MEIECLAPQLALLGHEEELQLLKRKIEALSQGKGGAILFQSPQELGQNLQVRTLLAELSPTFYYGVCQPYLGSEPYGILRQLFPDFFGQFQQQVNLSLANTCSGFTSQLYLGAAGLVYRKITAQPAQRPSQPYEPYWLHAEFARFLGQNSEPKIIYLEDYHWADLATLKLIKFLVYALRQTPILFVFTAVPDILETPELPPELRGTKVSVMEQLKVMQIANRLPLSHKSRREWLEDLQNEGVEVVPVKPMPEENLLHALKKVLGATVLSEYFMKKIFALSQGNMMLLGQILRYLLDGFLIQKGKKWQLQCMEQEIPLAPHIENILETNLDKLGPDVLQVLKMLALFGTAIPLALAQAVCSPESFARSLKTCQAQGILYLSRNSLIVFNNYKQRQTILNKIGPEEHKILHSAWSSYLNQARINTSTETNIALQQGNNPNPPSGTDQTSLRPYLSAVRCAYHAKHSDQPQTALEYFFLAGTEAENLLAFEEAYELYREAGRLFPEMAKVFQEMLQKIAQEMQNLGNRMHNYIAGYKFYQAFARRYPKAAGWWESLLKAVANKVPLPKEARDRHCTDFVEGIIAYRIAALAEGGPIFSPDSRWILKKLVYYDTPARFFPKLGPLDLYLLKVLQLDSKTYPHDDVLLLHDLVAKDLLPFRDWPSRVLWDKEAFPIQGAPQRYRLAAMKSYERWGNKLVSAHIKTACEYYLTAAFFAKEGGEFFHTARICHKIIRLCQSNLHVHAFLKYVQVEALRCLGVAYEKWALKMRDLHLAVQATSAYRDAVQRILEIKDASWLSQYLMERAFEVCEGHFLENEPIVDLLKTTKIKQELQAEAGYQGKALIWVDREDAGAADLLEEKLWEEHLLAEIRITPGENFIPEKDFADYRCSFILASPYSICWKKYWEHLRAMAAFIPGKEDQPGTGWFIDETPHHVCFILLGTSPAHLYRLTLDFCLGGVLGHYV